MTAGWSYDLEPPIDHSMEIGKKKYAHNFLSEMAEAKLRKDGLKCDEFKQPGFSGQSPDVKSTPMARERFSSLFLRRVPLLMEKVVCFRRLMTITSPVLAVCSEPLVPAPQVPR
jgi:hypothetical protein